MTDINRRNVFKLLATTSVGAAAGSSAVACKPTLAQSTAQANGGEQEMHEAVNHNPEQAILAVEPLPRAGSWPTEDPFLFCVHHNDRYPAGNESFGPNASLDGRQIGRDFANKDGWNMYHGQQVPGFPRHPHRGFETLTVVKTGLIDHADSLGATARYGDGDAQWLTAGDGINHAEMFPLLNRDEGNPMDFFQIWVNLPAARKRSQPHFSMFWANQIPVVDTQDNVGRTTKVRVVAGSYAGHDAPSPPPASWASEPGASVAVWTIEMDAQAAWALPAEVEGVNRSLYVVRGSISVGDRRIAAGNRVVLRPDLSMPVRADGEDVELLLLQGRPIGEPVVQHGPFVMNTRQEISEAIRDYQRTGFGSWHWPDAGPVHGGERQRFAQRADGSREEPA